MTSIFKGHHFASLKEWKGRKKGLWLVINPVFKKEMTPIECLDEIRKSRIMLTSVPKPLLTVKYIGVKRPNRKKTYAEKFTKPPFRYKFGCAPIRPRK